MAEPHGAAIPADQSRAMAELRELTGFHISLAYTTIKGHFQGHEASLDLTQKQIAILWLIGGYPGIIQSDLARMLRVKRATMWGMVGRLCDRDLLERPGTDGVDARHVTLKLTDAGRDILGRARQAILRHEAWLNQLFSPDERRTIARLMTRIHARRD